MKKLFFIGVFTLLIRFCLGQNLSYSYHTQGLSYPDWLNDPDYLAKNDNPNFNINNFTIVKVSCSKSSLPFKEEDIYLAVFKEDLLTDLIDLPDYYEDQYNTATVFLSIIDDKYIKVYYTNEKFKPDDYGNPVIEEQEISETLYSVTTAGEFKIELN
jgi:hypothetical protein